MSLSLRSFHLFFIGASILLAAGLGVWGIRRYLEVGDLAALVQGGVFLVVGVILAVYGLRVRRKLRGLEG